MSALRLHRPDGTLVLVDLGPSRHVPLPGHMPRVRPIEARSGMTRTDREAANRYAARWREKQREQA